MQEKGDFEQWVDKHPVKTQAVLLIWALAILSILTWGIHREYNGNYDVGVTGSGCECRCDSLGDRPDHD